MAMNTEERMKEITDRLQAGLEELFNSEKYAEYLRVMSQFHHYSFNNTLLIAMQKPDATLVAGYQAWQKKFNRHVMRGEKGIQIISPAPIQEKQEQEKVDPETGEVVIGKNGQPEVEEVTITIPRFKVATVFDLSQTDGDPLPELGVEELIASVENYDIFMEAIHSVAPVPIRFDEIESGAKGYYSSADKEIVIQSGMSEMQTMKTAVHETAHAILHDRDIMQAQGIQKDQQTREVEAESVAFATLAHFELDTSDYSFPYIAGWSSGRDTKELKSSLDTIRKTASEIIDGIETSMREQLLERQEQSVERTEDAYINMDSMGIIVDGHEGTWRAVEGYDIDGETFYLMESQEYGDDAAKILLHMDGDLVAEDLWNGIDYGAMQAVREYFDQKGISYSMTDFPLQARYAIDTVADESEPTGFVIKDYVTGNYVKENGVVQIYDDRAEVSQIINDMNYANLQVYYHSADYAREHGELDAYRASMQENRACAEGIEQVIRENFDGMHLNPNVVKPVIARFGAERTAFVLANTVEHADWDQRYSRSNKEWASSTIADAGEISSRESFLIGSHPAVLDGFIDLFRTEIRTLGLEQDGRTQVEKPFIDHFYVVEDLAVKGPLAITQYDTLDAAINAYYALPNDKLKALGIQNTKPLPGSLDFIQCENGIDTVTMDYTSVEVWNNPEIQALQADIDMAMALHDSSIAYEMEDGFFVIQNAADGFDYSFYDKDYHLLEGGLLDDPLPGELARTIKDAANEILAERGKSLDNCRVVNFEDFSERADAAEQEKIREPQIPQKETSLSYFVAECMEYPVLGEYHEVSTLQAAMKLYEQIPSERMNGGKGIGFNLDDGSDYAGAYPLVQGGKVVTDMIDLVEHYRDSPLVQQAVEDARKYYPDVRETEYHPREAEAPEPVVEQKSSEGNPVIEEQREPEPSDRRSAQVEKPATDQPTNKKESVLKALRERQARLKEQEKTSPEQKNRNRKKGEQVL